MRSCFTSLIILLTIPALARAELVAVGPFLNSSLFRIDSNTGAATEIGFTGLGRIPGLTQGPNGTLIGNSGRNIFQFDLNTGASTQIITPTGNFTVGEGALAYRQSTDEFYYIDSFDNRLARYDANLNTVVTIGDFGLTSRDISAGAFLGDTLYIAHRSDMGGVASDTILASVDLNTGASTDLYSLGMIDPMVGDIGVAGMTFDDQGRGFLTTGSELYRFDVAGQTISLVGSTGQSRLSGLAFVPITVPEPGLAFPLIVAGGLLACRRKRKLHHRSA